MHKNQIYISKKKIIFFMPNIERGGIEKNLIILTNYFINRKYEIFIVYSKISQEIKKKINKQIKLIKSKKIFYFNFLNNRVWDTLNCSICLLTNFKKQENILILAMQGGLFALLIAKLLKFKIIIRIANHPIGSLYYFNNFLFYKIKILAKIFFYKFADAIICNSNESKEFFLKKKFVNVTAIYNPIKKYFSNKKTARKNFILTVGRLEKQKNIVATIEAFKIVNNILPGYKLIIIGSGSERHNIKKTIKLLKLDKVVILKKFMNPQNFMKKSKLFVLNSLFEGMPNVLLECINYKLPIISSNCLSGPKEILANGKFGYLVKVNDHKKLADKILDILNNYDQAKNRAKKAFLSLKRFDQNIQCRKYEYFLDKHGFN